MSTCYQCGTELPDGAELCTHCGMAAAVPEAVRVGAASGDAASGDAATGDAATGDAATGDAASPVPLPRAPIQAAQPGPRLSVPTGSAARERLPRPSRRTLLIMGVTAAVAVGTGVGYALLKPPGPSSRVAVERYFDDLANNDVAHALTLVANAGQYQGPDFPLLTGEALAGKENRPTDMRVLGTDQATTMDRVRVSYRLGDTTVNQTIVARQLSDGAPYLLDEPFLRLTMDSPRGRPTTINGIRVYSNGSMETLVFPGAYTATAEGSALLTSATQQATLATSGAEQPQATISFGPPQLAPGAVDAVERLVRQRIDECARSTSPSPENCPFHTYLSGTDGIVKWTITSYPTVTVTVARLGSTRGQVEVEGSAGVARYEATYTDLFGTRSAETGRDEFYLHATASAQGSAITLSIS
jgi:hypothetical protein